MPEWTFLTNHALVLSTVAKYPRIKALEISQAIGVTERAVRKFIADLEAAGYITKTREGRGVRYSVNSHLPLRHATHRDRMVGDFLEALGWKEEQATDQSEKPEAPQRKELGKFVDLLWR